MEKLRILKGQLSVWNKEVFGDIQFNKKIIARIDEILARALANCLRKVLRQQFLMLRGVFWLEGRFGPSFDS